MNSPDAQPSSMDKLLSALVDALPTAVHDLQLSDPVPSEFVAELDTKEVDDLLREAEHRGLVYGVRQTGDGSSSWWSGLELSWHGLQRLGQWPLNGGEFLPGSWDDGYWGQVAKPLLRDLADSPPAHGFVFGPSMGEPDETWHRWQAMQRLKTAGLIRGEGGLDAAQGMADVVLTASGRRALDDSPADPLDRAMIELQRDAKVEALIAAVEEVLRPRLLELAEANDIETRTSKDKVIALGAINDQLGSAGVIRQDVRAEVAAYLQMRNEGGHGRAAGVSHTRIARAIAGIRELRDSGLL